MAVSKTQNERPAILALIDLANQLEGESNTHARNIATLTEGLARLANIKLGATEEITVPANDSYASSYVYPEPFGATSKSFVILGFADDHSQATLSVTLVDSTHSGFSYSIMNSGAETATVTIGYLAIAVG